jgi:hypothetical protein
MCLTGIQAKLGYFTKNSLTNLAVFLGSLVCNAMTGFLGLSDGLKYSGIYGMTTLTLVIGEISAIKSAHLSLVVIHCIIPLCAHVLAGE